MALDALEKDRLRKKLALRMGMFLESGTQATCVSSHFLDVPGACELCEATHAHELFVIKNRSGKKLRVAGSCLLEMVRFKVVDVDEVEKWAEKLKQLRLESEKRREETERQYQEDRRRLEKKVIVRRRPTA